MGVALYRALVCPFGVLATPEVPVARGGREASVDAEGHRAALAEDGDELDDDHRLEDTMLDGEQQ